MPGQTVRGELIVGAKRAVDTRRITLEITGGERFTTGSGKSAVTHRHTIMHLRAELSEEREVRPGRHRLPFTFQVPPDAPPSYQLPASSGRIEYEASARVDIPWWPDSIGRFLLRSSRIC